MTNEVSQKKGSARRTESSTSGNKNPRVNIFGARAAIYLKEIAAVIFAAGSVVTLLGMLGLTKGMLIDAWVTLLCRWMGWSAYIIPLLFAGVASLLFSQCTGQYKDTPWGCIVALEVALVSLMGLLSFIDGMDLTRAETGSGGGIIGWAIATSLDNLIGIVGAVLLLLIVFLLVGSYVILSWIAPMLPASQDKTTRQEKKLARDTGRLPAKQEPQLQVDRKHEKRERQNLPREYRKAFVVKDKPEEGPSIPLQRDERLPPLNLLECEKSTHISAREINRAAGLIEKTLADFGIPARVIDFRSGPSVTQFAVEPGFVEHEGQDGASHRQKVRISQISSLANDLALALSAPSLRIEAPVPGKAYVGIEVPNKHAALVRLGSIIQSEYFQSINSPLTIALGRDVSGAPIAADLSAMPHMLIAGTTGSGKSVCIASLAACLIINNTPEDLRLVMIDPKMVELIRFNGLPHLYGKVETELERIVGVLRWLTVEMDRRYKQLETAKARDIQAYNKRIRRRRNGECMPRIVVMIDELADLMMMAPDQTEHTLVRLAQMARSVGIHLILATQRPSTDVVTGLIKANFPARISFAVASGVDSRVILDTPGAETLLGKGDMLFLSPEAGAPIRLQGAFVSDLEIERLINYWQKAASKQYDDGIEKPPWEDFLERQAALEKRDSALERAIELVTIKGEASASMLQRGLRIGYPRAARLMDELEEMGVIGRPKKGGRTREVLISRDESQ